MIINTYLFACTSTNIMGVLKLFFITKNFVIRGGARNLFQWGQHQTINIS